MRRGKATFVPPKKEKELTGEESGDINHSFEVHNTEILAIPKQKQMAKSAANAFQ